MIQELNNVSINFIKKKIIINIYDIKNMFLNSFLKQIYEKIKIKKLKNKKYIK